MAWSREKRREYNKKYREINRGVIAEHAKKYYEANKEAISARRKKYREKKKQKKFWGTVPFLYIPPKTIKPFIPFLPLKHGYKRNELILLYFIRITRLPDEIFYKVGVTKYNLKQRYTNLKEGYYTRLSSAVLPAYLALMLEATIITKYSQYQYVPENFGGSTECFSKNLIKEFNKMVPEKYKEV